MRWWEYVKLKLNAHLRRDTPLNWTIWYSIILYYPLMCDYVDFHQLTLVCEHLLFCFWWLTRLFNELNHKNVHYRQKVYLNNNYHNSCWCFRLIVYLVNNALIFFYVYTKSNIGWGYTVYYTVYFFTFANISHFSSSLYREKWRSFICCCQWTTLFLCLSSHCTVFTTIILLFILLHETKDEKGTFLPDESLKALIFWYVVYIEIVVTDSSFRPRSLCVLSVERQKLYISLFY